MLKFDCLRCGNCCTNLVKEPVEGVHSGLALFPEETRQFPSESVFPYWGFGRYPEDRNFRIVMFQLGVETCPNFQITGNRRMCKVYEYRPLTCKSYPFEPAGLDKYGRILFNFSLECTNIQKMEKENPKANFENAGIEALTEEEAGYLIWDRFSQINMLGDEWVFDIKYREWLPSSNRTRSVRSGKRGLFRI